MKHTTLKALVQAFDFFLLDQFGVLLDGAGAYPQAPAALAELARQGKRIAILSNSGRRSGPSEDRLVRFGFDRSHFEMVISSGEAAHRVLADRIGRDIAPGAPVLVLAREGDLSCVDGLGLVPTDDADEARLVLISGSRGEDIPLEDYARLLEGPAARGVPALCTNPDMTMLTGRGPAFGAGRIAQLYRDLGGECEEIGKPHPLIYKVASDRLGSPDPQDVICIGDSPAHDIRGGHATGYATALVRTGIHADDPLERVLSNTPASDQPDYVIPQFGL